MTISKWNEPSLEHGQAIQQGTTPIKTNGEVSGLIANGANIERSFPCTPSPDDFNNPENILASQPTLLTVNQLCLVEPALTTGGVRHLLFTKGHNLPGVYRFGRKLLFDRAEFITGIKEGHTAQISGRAAK